MSWNLQAIQCLWRSASNSQSLEKPNEITRSQRSLCPLCCQHTGYQIANGFGLNL